MTRRRGPWLAADRAPGPIKQASGTAQSRQQRLREERMADRVPEWDDGVPGDRRRRPRWRLVHPDPYGGHGSLTAASFDKCQCRPCMDAAADYALTRSRARRAELAEWNTPGARHGPTLVTGGRW